MAVSFLIHTGKNMKKIAIIATILLVAGCVVKTELSVAQKLEQNPNLIKTLEIYTCMPGAVNVHDYISNNCAEQKQNWIEFKEPGIKYNCLDQNGHVYTTDECILYRREVRPSQIHYFDFGRFIPSDSQIKTEADFAMVAEKFSSIKSKLQDCEKQKDRTTFEKQACKDALLEPIIRFSEHGKQPCKTVAKTEYQDFLKNMVSWHKWAIKHDPKETRQNCLKGYAPLMDQLVALGQVAGAYEVKASCSAIPNIPVFTKNEAAERIRENAEKFSRKNLCGTDDYKTELKKLGLKL